MRLEMEHLPEFGVGFNWAMCPNFGIPFEGEIAKGRKCTYDDRYQIRVIPGERDRPAGEIRCRYCGQSSRLASNKAIRPIAHYILSLSLPFAVCRKMACLNHGLNLYEHLSRTGQRHGPYRPTGEHTARCNRYGTQPRSPGGSPSIVLGTARREADQPKTQQRWRGILDALQAGRSIADASEYLSISNTTYRRHLARLGARLGDYLAFRNARLLHPDIANSERPISLYTGVKTVGAQRNRWLRPSGSLPVTVTVTVASFAAPARSVVLVSNAGKDDDDTGSLSSYDHAQAFTTGSQRGGCRVTSVDVDFNRVLAATDAHVVGIWTSSSEESGIRVGDALTRPASLAVGLNAFTTSGIDLEPSTTYFLLIDSSSTNAKLLQNAASDDEDCTSAMRRSIGNGSVFRNRDDSGSWSMYSRCKKMRINGAEKSAVVPSLVSNTGETASSNASNSLAAQAFTTGANAGGYTLGEVAIRLARDSVATAMAEDLSTLPRLDLSGNAVGDLSPLSDVGALMWLDRGGADGARVPPGIVDGRR